MGFHTTTPLFPEAPTYGESSGVPTTIPCCLQAAERNGSPLRPWLRTDDLYPAATVALRLGKRALTLSCGFSTSGHDITYRAYVPYDDPSGLPAAASSYFTISLLFALHPFSSPSTKVVHPERRSPVTYDCVLPHANPIATPR